MKTSEKELPNGSFVDNLLNPVITFFAAALYFWAADFTFWQIIGWSYLVSSVATILLILWTWYRLR